MSKRNSNQKLTKKNWKVIIIAVILSAVVVPVLFNLTDGFDNVDLKDNLTRKLNEENYFFEQIKDCVIYDNIQVDTVAKSGVITLDGEIANTNPGTITLSNPVALATVTLPAGEYTFTCFKTPNIKAYYAVGTYTVDGDTYTWYADYEEAPNNEAKDELLQGKTVKLTEETVVTFEIRLVEGAKLDNVKAVPVLVEGDENGSLYAGFFK